MQTVPSQFQMRDQANAILNYNTALNFHRKVTSYCTEQEIGNEVLNM